MMRFLAVVLIIVLAPMAALANDYDAYQAGYNDGSNDVYTLSWHRTFDDQSAYIGGYNDGQEEFQEDEMISEQWTKREAAPTNSTDHNYTDLNAEYTRR